MSLMGKFKRKYISNFGMKNNYFMQESFKFLSSDYFKKSELDFYTVAFNNHKVIEYQILLMKKFLKGNFKFLVVDNSSDNEIADLIKNVCLKYDVSYFRILQKIYLKDSSFSHGMALNWIYYNLVHSRKNDFGFIDHDVFPIKEINISELLCNDDLYGLFDSKENNKYWYLWPGFCFYKYDFIKNFKVDFLPCKRCDTGGSNFESIYKNLNLNQIRQSSKVSIKVFETSFKEENYSATRCNIEYIDEKWIHSICASNWIDNDNKNEKIYTMLNTYLK